jgi:hypothetical protein
MGVVDDFRNHPDYKSIGQGIKFYNNSQYKQALGFFNNQLNLNSKNGFAWYYKGKCLEKICKKLIDDETSISDRINKFENDLQNIEQSILNGENYEYRSINPKPKNQTFGSWKYYQTTTSQLFWGYSRRKITKNNKKEEISLIQDRIDQLKEQKNQIFQKRKNYLEDSEQCRIRANKLGVY